MLIVSVILFLNNYTHEKVLKIGDKDETGQDWLTDWLFGS